jgi:indolepyruvate ferredoxin oxidoreductase beta subunit
MKDPLNLVIIGVGGQGNVVISQLISDVLVREGYLVTFAQTYSSAQRGGSVVNYVRISKETECSPLIPAGHADVIIALEPAEAIRMLGQFGNRSVTTIVNPRPIQLMEMAGGEAEYPDLDKLMATIKRLSARTLAIKATEEAQRLGNAIVANVIIVGALVGSGVLPLDRESIEPVLRERFPRAVEINMIALNRGMELAAGQ